MNFQMLLKFQFLGNKNKLGYRSLLFLTLLILFQSCLSKRSYGKNYEAAQLKSTPVLLNSSSEDIKAKETSANESTFKKPVVKQTNPRNPTQAATENLSPVFKDPKRSFRGVWVATVANIDWPKHPNDSFEKMQEDYKALLQFYKDLHFNAVVVQVRTAGDALYPSDLAPWSKYLSGKEGLPPKTDLDPLAWLIETTHAYGMDFHAWINPYRATMSLNSGERSKEHDFYTHRQWLIPYGNKYYYNPGLPEVQSKLIAVVHELVEKYDIQGIHLDDYFYPYQLKNEVFNDQESYATYGKHLPLDSWRRQNIDSLISGISRTLKQLKPWVSFGVSPFGVWKNKDTDPKGSDTRAGQTTYEDLYADPLLWMDKGWIDYLAPQLYWSMDYELASHKTLVDWWVQQKSKSRIYIGYGAYKIYNNADPAWDKKEELANQISYGNQQQELEGQLLFSAKSLMQAPLSSVVSHLKKTVFREVVLAPTVGPRHTAEQKHLSEGKGVTETKGGAKTISASEATAAYKAIPWKARASMDAQGVLRINSKDTRFTKYIPYSPDSSSEIFHAGPLQSVKIPFKTSGTTKFIKGVDRHGWLSQAIPVTVFQ